MKRESNKTLFSVALHGKHFRVHYRRGDLSGIMQPYFNNEVVAQLYCDDLRQKQPCIEEFDDGFGNILGRVHGLKIQTDII